jgi:hypothetical protein
MILSQNVELSGISILLLEFFNLVENVAVTMKSFND